MKRFVLHTPVFCLVLFIAFGCDTDSNINDPTATHFVKYYGGDGNQAGVDMLVLSDGNVLLLGNSQFSGAKSVYLVKVDPKGEVLWEKTFEGTNEVAVDIEPIADGNFVILAELETTAENHDVKLIVVSPDGNEIMSASYGTPSNKTETPKSVTPLRNGGFIVTGVTVADTATNPSVNPDLFSNIFHYRCDASLSFTNSNWYEYYGATDQVDGAVKTFQDATDNFYVFGYSDQVIKPQQQGKLTMLYYRIGDGGTADSEVAILGDEAQNIRTDYVHRVGPELGGGFLVVGTTLVSSGTNSLRAARLREELEFNPVRDEQFDREIPVLSTSVEGVAGTTSLVAPQGFLLLGEELRSVGTKNLSLTKIDQVGQLVWTVSLGSEDENDEAAAVAETIDGRILVLGTIQLGDNQNKMALFKLNSTGRLHD
ncbi:MAG TPA: hypothetical protein VGD65_26845 [Chryseosolibacter sp.]